MVKEWKSFSLFYSCLHCHITLVNQDNTIIAKSTTRIEIIVRLTNFNNKKMCQTCIWLHPFCLWLLHVCGVQLFASLYLGNVSWTCLSFILLLNKLHECLQVSNNPLITECNTFLNSMHCCENHYKTEATFTSWDCGTYFCGNKHHFALLLFQQN